MNVEARYLAASALMVFLSRAEPGIASAAVAVGQLPDATTTEAPRAEDQYDESDDEGPESVFYLPQIIVSAKRIKAPPSLVVREVTVEDIQARNAHTVGDALIYVPGVNVQVGGTSGDARAWIRGYRDRDVLVLFDGIPVATGFEGTIDLNEIAVQRVSTINVLKSAPSVIYGTNGVGGVIDVVPESGVTGTFLDGTIELGGDDRAFAQASGGGGNGNVSIALSAQYQQSDDFSLSDDYVPVLHQPAGKRVNSDFERSSVFFQFDALETPIGHTSFFYNFADADKGLAVEAGVEDPAFERLTKSRRNTMGLSNDFDGIPLSLSLYYNSYDSELTIYTDDSFTEVDDVEVAEDYAWGAKLYSTLETSGNNKLVLTAGLQTDVYQGEGQLENGNKAELATWTVAAEDQYWITDTLSVAAGAIFVYFDQTRLDQTSNAFNPQIALAWQVTPKVTVHASAAQRTRFPKLRELYRRRFGNPDLEPQTAENYELGLVFNLYDGWTTDMSVFHSNIDGLIERADRRALYTNFEPVTITGFEAATSYWFTEAFFTRLAYTFVDASEDLPGGGSRQLRSRPRNTALAELRYMFPHDVQVSLSGVYVSGLYDLDPDDVYTGLSNYFVANFKAGWTFAEHYELYLAWNNVADTDYLQRLGDPREGRTLSVGLSAGF